MTIKDIELDPEKGKVNLQGLKKEYYDLINGITHQASCHCRSCVYYLYREKFKGKGRKFNKESFFLDKIAFEIKNSNMWRTPIYRNLRSGKSFDDLTYKIKFKEFLISRDSIKDLCDFIKKEFPSINSNPSRIKSKLWRLRKSKIVNELESEIWQKWRKTQPEPSLKKRKKRKRNWKDLKISRDIAEYIQKQPGQEITRRDLQRHFNIKIEDLERIGPKDVSQKEYPGLLENYGIKIRREGYRNKTMIYYSTTKSSKGRYWRVGI